MSRANHRATQLCVKGITFPVGHTHYATLTVSHSQLELTETVMQADASSDFKNMPVSCST